jgi:hypothetical protein
MLNLQNFQEPHFLFWVFGIISFGLLIYHEVNHRKKKREKKTD